MHATHIGDALEEPGSGEPQTLHCRALQDLFFIKPPLSRAGNVAEFLNTEPGRELDKMRRQRAMSQIKEEDKTTARELSKRDIYNMSDGNVKVMIIKVLNGCEKRVEDLSEILNKDTGNIKTIHQR